MRPYLQVAKNTIDEYLTYRLNFIMWRVRTVLRVLVIFFLWNAIFTSTTRAFGYTQSQMLSYILGVAVAGALVFATRTQELGNDINEGNLSNYLLKPISYFRFLIGRDVTDKLFNSSFAVVELSILAVLFRPPLFFQTDPLLLLLTIVALVLANILYMMISILLGCIAFWSPETWGPRFLFFMLLDFFAGGMFPIDILPKPIFNVLQLLPFSYLIYFPVKIYLGQMTLVQIASGIGISLFWVIVLGAIMSTVWKVGLRSYTAVGR